MIKARGRKFTLLLLMAASWLILSLLSAHAENYQPQIEKLQNWLLANRDQATGLPHSHVGDARFANWAITYDSAVTAMAYTATGRLDDARRILDFYIQTPKVWRLGGIIEAVNPTGRATIGEDWSVRTGANLWMGMAGFHLYRSTGEAKYLDLARKIADFAITLQNDDAKDPNFGGVRLGPKGAKNYPADQRLGSNENQPTFFEVYATEHNIDAYALFNMLYAATHDEKYKTATDKALRWLKDVGYNNKLRRFNRGARDGGSIDAAVATDVHAWGISALGVKVLDTFEPGLAEKMIGFVESDCLPEVSFTKPDRQTVKIRGADFVDQKTALGLGRWPMVSPEWTFEVINAYRRLEADLGLSGDVEKITEYRRKREYLVNDMLKLAIASGDTLAYPYATRSDASVGHEYNTPRKGNLSTIGVAYGILALSGFEPLEDGRSSGVN